MATIYDPTISTRPIVKGAALVIDDEKGNHLLTVLRIGAHVMLQVRGERSVALNPKHANELFNYLKLEALADRPMPFGWGNLGAYNWVAEETPVYVFVALYGAGGEVRGTLTAEHGGNPGGALLKTLRQISSDLL